MSWAKLDDGMPENGKVLRVGMVGLGVHVAAICYSSRQLTDGVIPVDALPRLTGLPRKQAISLADLLWQVRLWHRPGDVCETEETKCPPLLATLPSDSYLVHDYLIYNPSRTSVLSKRDADLRRKRGGFQTELRGNPTGIQKDSVKIPSLPDPDPDPDPQKREEKSYKHSSRSEALRNGSVLARGEISPTLEPSREELRRRREALRAENASLEAQLNLGVTRRRP